MYAPPVTSATIDGSKQAEIKYGLKKGTGHSRKDLMDEMLTVRIDWGQFIPEVSSAGRPVADDWDPNKI